ncbi:Met-10+ like-protein-domain-containing protein [Pilobolus umbonatus]|nr:Met-10+ like-protein-domain-containing protein [Pilobolus umbonatus]
MALQPPQQRGITRLDRSLFDTTVETLAIRVPRHHVKMFTTLFQDQLLNQSRISNVVADKDSTQYKLVLLNMNTKIEDLTQGQKTCVDEKSKGIIPYSLTVGYDYWTADQLLHSILRDDDIPTAYTVTGHIAHVNLKESDLPFKQLIAQIILDKNKKITSVVNKTNQIDNTYRNFQMEILAGDNNTLVELKENECKFKFDFAQVYWNSRLQAEHHRLVQMFKPGDFICDVMAGVGPFSIPAAKRGAIVYANDLNPASYHWLCENIQLNKLNSDQVKAYNMDGRLFIQQAIHDLWADKKKTFQHFIMNLPAIAIEFLDAFIGVYRHHQDALSPASLPIIHCHCFTRDHLDITKRLHQTMGVPVEGDCHLHFVRTVAPKKDMYCVSFRLHPEVAYASTP